MKISMVQLKTWIQRFYTNFNAPKFDAQEWVSIMNNGGAKFGEFV